MSAVGASVQPTLPCWGLAAENFNVDSLLACADTSCVMVHIDVVVHLAACAAVRCRHAGLLNAALAKSEFWQRSKHHQAGNRQMEVVMGFCCAPGTDV